MRVVLDTNVMLQARAAGCHARGIYGVALRAMTQLDHAHPPQQHAPLA